MLEGPVSGFCLDLRDAENPLESVLLQTIGDLNKLRQNFELVLNLGLVFFVECFQNDPTDLS